MRFLLLRQRSDKSDEELIRDLKKTDGNEALSVLFERYSHLLFAVSLNILKDEESAKDAVLNLFEKLPSDLRKYEIRNFSVWIHQVTKNYCYRLLRQSRNTLITDDLEGRLPHDEDSLSGQDDLLSQQLTDLQKGLEILEENQRRCIELFYFRELSYEEMMRETGFTYKQVKSYLQNGKRNLRIYLQRKNATQR